MRTSKERIDRGGAGAQRRSRRKLQRLWASAVILFSATGYAHGQSCDLYVAALAAVGADSTNTVVADHTVMGVPTFAFNAYSSIRGGDTAMARVAEPQLRASNATRVALPQCMTVNAGWHTIDDSTLFSIFRGGGAWPSFRERYPKTPNFALVSQPIITGDTATIYVAVARGELNGFGTILRFVRDNTGRWVKKSEAQLWVS